MKSPRFRPPKSRIPRLDFIEISTPPAFPAHRGARRFLRNSTEIDDIAALRSGRAARLLAAGLAGRAVLLGLELCEFLVSLGAPDLLDSLGLGTQTDVLLLQGVGLGKEARVQLLELDVSPLYG